MEKNEYRCLIISDFNATSFAGYLTNDHGLPKIATTVAPFGQVVQVLMANNMDCWEPNPDFAVIWTQPESVIHSFKRILNYESVSIDEVLAEVTDYASLLLGIQNRVTCAFVPAWVTPSYHRGLGMLDMKNGVGIANVLMRMNLTLCDYLDKSSNIYVLNTQKWIESHGKYAFSPKLWYMGKIAFGNEVFKEGVRNIKTALRGSAGMSKKLIIVDLDDTLWGGIIGDIGWEAIRLGGHDFMGEAYADFQRALKSLTNRGVLLGIVSKNEESTVVEAFRKHPEMVLTLEDFAGWRINRKDKAENIIELVSELNLGIDSVVFIDDNPYERQRVRDVLPEVVVPEWPEDRMLYKKTLVSLSCFDNPSITKEDIHRTKLYAAERQRSQLRNRIGSLEEWLATLDTKVTVESLNDRNIHRATQLLNKTNQMNLSTRRMTERELVGWVEPENRILWTFHVTDKFGDSGLTGIVSLEAKNGRGTIIDFILSCRVMGRKVEESMLYTVITYAQSINLDEIYAKHIPTPKNKPCLDFWKTSGFIYNEADNTFYWKVSTDYPLAKAIQIEGDFVYKHSVLNKTAR